MHVYFSGIGGAGIGPLAQIAQQAGYTVSGSDQQASAYICYLRDHGINNVHISQTVEAIANIHAKQPIDWLVHSSSIPRDHPELVFCRQHGIKISKRDELLNQILQEQGLKLVAIAGTHGKTTTTALVTWLFTELKLPVSYLLPAKTNFAEMGKFDPAGEYFIYEADEFDRNFLAYEPALSLITGVSWDHHEIFPSREDYQAAFREFISQSKQTLIWQEDADYLGYLGTVEIVSSIYYLDSGDQAIDKLSLIGKYNRLDGWLAVQAVHHATKEPLKKLIEIVNRFPGLSRRMEQIIPNLYSDYAHTPEKIRGAMSVATEMAAETGRKLIVIYEPLTNRRQHYMINDYGDCFIGADKLYWIPSYRAREDPAQRVISPSELISHLSNPSIATPMKRNAKLQKTIQRHLDQGDMLVAMAGGGGNSLDDWLRTEFKP